MEKITAKISPSDEENPVVGMGATEVIGSDRRAFTVVEILSKTRIVVQRDKVTRVDRNGLSEDQDYVYEADPDGQKFIISRRKGGKWTQVGSKTCHGLGFVIGKRREYSDPSF